MVGKIFFHTHFLILIYRKVSTSDIRVSWVSLLCTFNLEYFYIKAELDVHCLLESWLLWSGSGLFKRLEVYQKATPTNLIHFWTLRITLVLSM